ncbi:phage tail spike protein [Hathewaya histolytica]|uniref:Phage structural protein n=1 Tax=Hathewaya histolytica TaxID=1498 RepID=A0A4V6KEY6_HATHI|nr:phage tail spike protein [Hathewaya histolytica]VTQ93737.1 phage structural protein [Hathewaya histolytica]
MISLYNANEVDFNHNGTIIKPTACKVTEELNGIFELELEHPLDKEGRWEELLEENIIKASTPRGDQLFRIYKKVKTMSSILIYARHIFYDLLDNMLVDVRIKNLKGNEAIKSIFNNTLNPNKFNVSSNILKASTAHYSMKNPVEALLSDNENSFLNSWGGELLRDNFNIHMDFKIGINNGVRIKYGKNLLGIKEDLNLDTVVTRIVPLGYNGIMLDKSKPYVDSPLINIYGNIKTKEIKFDHIKLKEDAQEGETGYTLQEARKKLIEECKKIFENGLDKPAVSYEADFLLLSETEEYKDYKVLENVNLGDTVTIQHKKLNIDLQSRVIGYEYNCLTKNFNKLNLGNFLGDYIKSTNQILRKAEKIFNDNGTVNPNQLQGAIDFHQVKMKAMKDVAKPQDVLGIIFEDRLIGSKTYGAMALGTMGFMIADSFKPGTDEWDFRTFGTGSGFTADLLNAGILQSLDGTMKIDLDNARFLMYEFGKRAIELKNNSVVFYDWEGTEEVGKLYSAQMVDNPKQKGIDLACEPGSFLSLSHKPRGESYYKSYMTFDNKALQEPFPIKFNESFNVGDVSQYWWDWKTKDIDAIMYSSDDGTLCLGHNHKKNICLGTYWIGDKFLSPTLEIKNPRNDKYGYGMWVYQSACADKDLHVNGNFTVAGQKNCVQKTKFYGDITYNSYETPGSWLGDYYFGSIGEDGVCYVELNDKFIESVNTIIKYHVISSIYKGKINEIETLERFVKVTGTPGTEFSLNIIAKRRGFESVENESIATREIQSYEDIVPVQPYPEDDDILEESVKKEVEETFKREKLFMEEIIYDN